MIRPPATPGSIVAVTEIAQPPPFSPWLRLAHLFSYPPGERASTRLRQLRDWEFVLQLEGRSWLHLEAMGGSVPVEPGSLVLIPPGVVHGQCQDEGRHIAVHFDLQAQTDLVAFDMLVYTGGQVGRRDVEGVPVMRWRLGPGDERLVPLIGRPADPATWRRRFEPLIAQWSLRTLDRPAERLAAAGILATAVSDHIALAPDAPAALPLAGILAGIDVCDRRLRVQDLARRAGMGETAFRAAVHALTGRSPRDWLEERRLEVARRLLAESRLSVAAVARAVGYDDPFHFSRVCRRRTGLPPTALRPEG